MANQAAIEAAERLRNYRLQMAKLDYESACERVEKQHQFVLKHIEESESFREHLIERYAGYDPKRWEFPTVSP